MSAQENTSPRPFYFVKDGRPACRIIHPGEPFPPELYTEVTPPHGVRECSYTLHNAMWGIACAIGGKTGVMPDVLSFDRAGESPLPSVFIGRLDCTDFSLLGDADAAHFAVGVSGDDLYTAAQTPIGYLEAASHIARSILYSEDGRDAFLPPEALGVFERPMPEVKHAFPRTMISFYGPPYTYSKEPADWLADEDTFNDILAFGADEVPLYAHGITSPERVGALRALIKKFHAHGVTVRLYGAPVPYSEGHFYDEMDVNVIRESVKEFIDRYSDLDGISQWGLADEPDPRHVQYYVAARAACREFDPKKRPTYINMGPRAHCRGIQNFYDRVSRVLGIDYYCLDRYPFFMTERGPEMKDPYFYAHLELNRSYAVDYGRDNGLILAAIKVGADPERADIDETFMRWQTNFLLAYGGRYLEQYVYYHAHDFSILDRNNKPTFRWYLAQKANRYVKTVGRCVLDDKTVDAVFHLPNADGSCDIDTIPYYAYRNAGEVWGVDAALSFLSDGTIMVTDKRCDAFRGGNHEIVLTGLTCLTGKIEWFNADAAAWEDISSCAAARLSYEGLTLTLDRASQYIVRRR